MYFRSYWLSKTWLKNFPKNTVSEPPLTVNMWKGPKHLWNLHERSFIILFDYSEGKWLIKYLSYGTLKSQRCLLTFWLPMRTIPLGIVRICSCQFKCNYLRAKNFFWIFCSVYGIFIKFETFLKKGWSW